MSRGISTVDQGLSIPELIKIVKQSFRESEFDAVENALMDRERKMKIEIENLRMGHESVKKEARLLEKSRKLAESEKLILEEKCMELNDRIKSFKTKFGKMEKEIKVLRQGRKELKRQKLESDEKAECYKIRIENLEPRIMKVEGALADILNVKVQDLAPLANSMDKSAAAAAKGENVDINSDKVSQGLGNVNAIETEPLRCWRTDGRGWQCKRHAILNQKFCELHIYRHRRAKKLVLNAQSVNTSLPRTSGRNLDYGDSSTKDDGASTAQTSPGSQSGGSPLVEPRVPGKVIGADAGNVIEICDSDDESNCEDKFVSETSLTKSKKRSRIDISDEEDDNIPIDGKENQDPESTQDRIIPPNDVPGKPITNAGPCDDSQTHDICTDSEDDSSCSDGHMNNLIATIQSKKLGRT
ncbi:hypothetical protein ACS0TY_021779 [Phlomoides rotata]